MGGRSMVSKYRSLVKKKKESTAVNLEAVPTESGCLKSSQFIAHCKGDISYAFKTAKIILFDAMLCRSPDVPLQDEVLC